jgi:hypothetical protein
MSNPYVMELREIGLQMRQKTDQIRQEEQTFQSQQLDKQIVSAKEALEDAQAHEVLLEDKNNQSKERVAYMTAIGRDANSTKENDFADITKAYQNVQGNVYKEQDIALKGQEIERKKRLDLDQKRKYLEDLKLKKEEMQLKRDTLKSNEFIATINKA